MNENIEKLAIRASTYADNQCMKVKKLKDGESWISIRDKKFAELIVKECAKFIDENSGYNDSNGCWFPEPEDMLKYFGVE